MRILIACESSDTEGAAFRALGHDVTTCDTLPSDGPARFHYQGDVRDLIAEPWDLVVAHPPCTYLSNSGARWLYTEPLRWQQMVEGAAFFRLMSTFNSQRIAIENPIQHKWAKLAHGLGQQTQVVQPWMFGHPETKATCLWLYGLAPLVATSDARAEMATLTYAEQHRIHYASPGPDRWQVRSKALPGMAAAMAQQWSVAVDQENAA